MPLIFKCHSLRLIVHSLQKEIFFFQEILSGCMLSPSLMPPFGTFPTSNDHESKVLNLLHCSTEVKYHEMTQNLAKLKHEYLFFFFFLDFLILFLLHQSLIWFFFVCRYLVRILDFDSIRFFTYIYYC